ncbi:MAG: hypothetical protein JWO36_3206 [Myxococcales bacterium]|nr:hypothetical protein [Myxococcales bacterium]
MFVGLGPRGPSKWSSTQTTCSARTSLASSHQTIPERKSPRLASALTAVWSGVRQQSASTCGCPPPSGANAFSSVVSSVHRLDAASASRAALTRVRQFSAHVGRATGLLFDQTRLDPEARAWRQRGGRCGQARGGDEWMASPSAAKHAFSLVGVCGVFELAAHQRRSNPVTSDPRGPIPLASTINQGLIRNGASALGVSAEGGVVRRQTTTSGWLRLSTTVRSEARALVGGSQRRGAACNRRPSPAGNEHAPAAVHHR